MIDKIDRRVASVRSLTGQRGQVMVLVALLLPVLCGMAGTAVDVGYLYARTQAAQSAADAAAQAAAIALANGKSNAQAASDATTYATANGFTTSNSTISVNVPATSGTYANQAGSAQVSIQIQTSPILAPVVGVTHLGSTTSAVGLSGGTTWPCGLCVLAKTGASSLNVQGSGHVSVSGSSVLVNSSDTSSTGAMTVQNAGSVTATAVEVNGSSNTSGGTVTPSPAHAAQINDPLAALPVPSVATTYSDPNISNGASKTINPGVYPSITLNFGTLTMNPGTYVIKGQFSAGNAGTLHASGVTLYFACSSYPTPCTSGGQAGGSLCMSCNSGTNAETLTAPTTGTYAGVSVFYDRNNTSSIEIENGTISTVTGTIYGASATLDLEGGTSSATSNVVVYKAKIENNAGLSLTYNASDNYSLSGNPYLAQ